MRELDLQERHLQLEEEQLKFQHEQWARRNAEPVFANVPCNESAQGVRFVYAQDEGNEQAAEPDLHVLQPARMERILKHHEM